MLARLSAVKQICADPEYLVTTVRVAVVMSESEQG
jgi:hypothetical protein